MFYYRRRDRHLPVDFGAVTSNAVFLFLSTGGKKCLQFCATDGKKLTPTKSLCQTQSKKKPVSWQNNFRV
jgi:hypothetical protein